MMKANIRSIAFHLPQYHPIPENDDWWGKGFTEWRNVVKECPRFQGHYQPHLPADLGFYDLRLPEARQAQADLAETYGISGFCYYHYWFNGRRLLERPVNEIITSGNPDFPFCLCWANENWTRRWDGQDDEVLLGQNYEKQDDLDHIRWLSGVFMDPRYIRVDDRPLFLVYRISALPEPQRTVETWREEARKIGVGEIFICNVESCGSEHGVCQRIGIDGTVEFAPDWNKLPARQEANRMTTCLSTWPKLQDIAKRLGLTQPALSENRVHSYEELMRNMLNKEEVDYLRFPCVTPAWDNSARRQTGATILQGSTPQLYEEWLSQAIAQAKKIRPTDPIVFINAWNEWAEGSHLEPCLKWGHAYLEATRNALRSVHPLEHK